MKSLYISILLLACFQSYGWAQQRIAAIPDSDARGVMDELKRKDTIGMFRQREARPIIPRTGQVSRATDVGNTGVIRQVISRGGERSGVSERPRQVEERREGEFFRPVIPKPQPPQPARAEAKAAASQSGMVRYFLEPEQPYVQAEPSLYLEDGGGIARTFYRNIEYPPLMIQVKLKPNEALSFYSGGGEKFCFKRIEDVPMDGVLYTWKLGDPIHSRQVFLRFGSICGLDGDKNVALCYKSGHQEVVVRKARIVTLDVPKKNK